jgi:folate-dependent tRNA-U54 methylase TrmFO/GidA
MTRIERTTDSKGLFIVYKDEQNERYQDVIGFITSDGKTHLTPMEYCYRILDERTTINVEIKIDATRTQIQKKRAWGDSKKNLTR